MRHGFDRGVAVGIGLLAVLMVGIAATSYLNTRRLWDDADRVSHSRDVIDAIDAVRFDTVRLQADLRVYLVTGFPEALTPYDESAARLKAEAVKLAEEAGDDPVQQPHVAAARREIEAGVAGFNGVIKLRGGPGGHAAVVALARERGSKSFADPLLDTLRTMTGIERERLAQREVAAQGAYRRAIFYGGASAALGLVAVGLFVATLSRSLRARARDTERLAEQRELLSATLTSIGDAVIATDKSGNVTFLNPVAERLTGWPQAEARGVPLERVFHIVNESTRVPVENPAIRALNEGMIVGLANHTILISRDGAEVPIDDSAAPIRTGGVVGGAVLVFRDISDKKRAEAAQARLAAIVESSDDAVVGKSLDGTIEFWNAGAERVYGYPAAEAVGRPITLIIPPDRLDEEKSLIERIRRGERIDHFETVRVAKGGGRVDVSLTVSPIRDASGRLVGVSKVARDMTRVKAGERALAEARRRSEAALQAGEVGTYYWDIAADRVNGDRNFVAIFGVLANENSSAPVADFLTAIHPDDRDRVGAAIRHTLDTDAPFHSEYRVAGPAGERWVIARGVVDRDAAGGPTGWAGVLVDVTRQREAEERLRRSEERRRLALDAGGLGTWNIDAATSTLTSDERFNAIFHGSPDPISYERAFAAIHPGDRERVRAGVAAAMNPGDPAPYAEEYRVVHPDGSTRWAAAKGVAHFEGEGPGRRLVSLDGTIVDITDRVAAESERAQLHERVEADRRLLDAVFDALPVGLVVADPGGRLVRMNEANERLWGGPPATNSIAEYAPWVGYRPGSGKRVEPHEWPLARVLTDGRAVAGEAYEIEPFDGGERRHVIISGAPIRDAAGRPVAGVIALVDVTERERAEERLRASEERFRSLFESMDEGYCVVEPVFDAAGRAADYRYLLVNPALEQHTGLRDVVGRTAREVMPGHESHWIETYARVAATGEAVRRTDWVADLGRWFDVSAFPVGPGRVGVLFNDITARQRAEEALRASEERLRVAVAAAKLGEWTLDLRTAVMTCSAGCKANYGRGPDDSFTYEELWAAVHPDDLDRVRATVQAAVESRTDYDTEYRAVWPDGSLHWVLVRGRASYSPGGEPETMTGVTLDITDRKRIEEREQEAAREARATAEAVRFLSDASASLAELVDYESTLHRIANLAVGRFADWCVVDVLDEAGDRRRLAVNGVEAAAAADPGAAETAVGVPHVLKTGEPELVPDVAALDPATARQGPDRIGQLRGWGIESYLAVPLLSRGRVIGGMTFLRASAHRRYGREELLIAQELAVRVTTAIENASLYRTLQDQDRRKDEFLATLAHELRNPLAPVRNGVHILRATVPADERTGRTLAMMDRQLGHMVHLVDDLMDVARVSSGKVVLRKERVELRAVVEAAAESTRQVVEAGGHELAINLPTVPLAFDADRTRLVQVLANLLNNAAKYTPHGGRIAVSASRLNGYAVVRVADSGVGIAADMLPRVFDMFTQVGTSLERSQGGLGIGLTLVKRLVEMHGGSVSAESPGPGRGSTFTVRLPLAEAAALPNDAVTPEAASAPSRLSVLVVDDNVDAAESLGMLLEMKGHEVRTAHDGPEALRVLGAYRPDLVVLDIGLPGMTGYEVARRIRESDAFRGITLAALTGWGQEEDRRRSREAGFDHHLTKPADPAEVERILGEVTGR